MTDNGRARGFPIGVAAEVVSSIGIRSEAFSFILNPAAVLIGAKDLGPPCNCGLRFRRAQAELAGSADDHAGTDAAFH